MSVLFPQKERTEFLPNNLRRAGMTEKFFLPAFPAVCLRKNKK